MNSAADPARTAEPEVLAALRAHVGRRIVRLIDVTDKRGGGTAVKVQLGDQFFLATAGHVVPHSHDVRALIPGTPERYVASFQQRLANSSCDVALLELSPADAESLGGNFVSADEIAVGFDHEPSPVLVAGYPGQLIDAQYQEVLVNVPELVYDIRSLAFFTETLPRSEWPTELEQAPTEDTDVFASFEPELRLGEIKLNDPSMPAQDVEIEKLDLRGMSGGGIWVAASAQTRGVWRPDLKLIALDVSYLPAQKWLRGTLFDRWLDVVVEHYADLEDTVQSIRTRRKR